MHGRRSWPLGPLVLGFVVGLASCLDHELEDGADPVGDQLIALDRDFANFRSWPVTPAGVGEHAGLTGPKNVYINRKPDPGATRFPVGTMVVKTIEVLDPAHWVAHAMVKRGGNFNAMGAFGWEFFDLKLDAAGHSPTIMWRGERPPSGHGYESLPGVEAGTQVECNTCHIAANNDSVISIALGAVR